MTSDILRRSVELQDYTAVFLDFDGVIKESTSAKTYGFARLFAEYGRDIQDRVVHHHQMHAGISRFEKIPYYFNRFLGRNPTEGELQSLYSRYSLLTNEAVVQSSWVEGVREYLDSCGSQQDIYIITGTPQKDIDWIVRRIDIKKYFKGVLGSPRTKTEILSELIESHQYINNQCVMIGDALADYEAALNVGIDFLLRLTPENQSVFKEIQCPRISDFKELL